jgi:hypothetical protein
MMYDTTSPVRTVDGTVRVTDDDGKILAMFGGNDLRAWRQFQLDVLATFNVVVTDNSMPLELSKTITGPNKHDDKFVPSG